MTSSPLQPGIVLLAAGGASRMGSPKQLLSLGRETLLGHACRTALETPFRPVIVVLGAQAVSCRKELEGLPIFAVVNEEWEKGLAGSLRVGLSALEQEAPGVGHVLVLLGDQPQITARALQRLVESAERAGNGLAASFYNATLGVPALFPRDLFPELRALQGDIGARRVLAAHSDRVTSVPLPEGIVDLDTPDEYRIHLRDNLQIDQAS